MREAANGPDRGTRRDQDVGAAEEVAPRPIGSGLGEPATAPVSGPGAVDENRPADIVGQEGLTGLTAPRVRPSVLHHPHAIGGGVSTHVDTAGQELVEDEDE
ncbi:MAG: hypothetical protein ACK47B_14260 [Armatimonadota bacterium]